jgi:hypothetical protein
MLFEINIFGDDGDFSLMFLLLKKKVEGISTGMIVLFCNNGGYFLLNKYNGE